MNYSSSSRHTILIGITNSFEAVLLIRAGGGSPVVLAQLLLLPPPPPSPEEQLDGGLTDEQDELFDSTRVSITISWFGFWFSNSLRPVLFPPKEESLSPETSRERERRQLDPLPVEVRFMVRDGSRLKERCVLTVNPPGVVEPKERVSDGALE